MAAALRPVVFADDFAPVVVFLAAVVFFAAVDFAVAAVFLAAVFAAVAFAPTVFVPVARAELAFAVVCAPAFFAGDFFAVAFDVTAFLAALAFLVTVFLAALALFATALPVGAVFFAPVDLPAVALLVAEPTVFRAVVFAAAVRFEAVPEVFDAALAGAVFLAAPARFAVAFLVGAVMVCLLGSQCDEPQVRCIKWTMPLSGTSTRHAVRMISHHPIRQENQRSVSLMVGADGVDALVGVRVRSPRSRRTAR